MAVLADILKHTIIITGFVFVMMLVIEYVNVFTSGRWQCQVAGNRFGQILLTVFLGATPGCLGAFATVALYTHRIVGVAALTATMIATSGDEAFVMFAMFPAKALLLTAILFGIAMATGIVMDLVLGKRFTSSPLTCDGFEFHAEEPSIRPSFKQFVTQWRECSLARGTLVMALLLFLFALLVGGGHGAHPAQAAEATPAAVTAPVDADIPQVADEPIAASAQSAGMDPGRLWVKVTLVLAGLLGLFIAATVPEHFLEEHLWRHVALKHVPRVFLWTFGALIVMHLLTEHLHLENWMEKNPLVILSAACLMGIIPESGPHLIFVTLFAQGMVPFSVLLASSIVQDGHGMLPLLAHSRKAFIGVKAVNFAVGFAVGLLGWLLHF
ncbi:MAG: arsenic efflux protein [Planctomycetes bacterium]|nr:arsenic efflux protein [Planctomycetota bacterium]